MKRLFCVLGVILKKIVESILIVVALIYFVFVFDIYINTERLNKINPTLNVFCENIARNPNFTKGLVVFRVDRGTLVFRLDRLFSTNGLNGYSPFFLFPHHRTIILSENVFKTDKLMMTAIVAHELGHIQGGLKHFGLAKEMELYANNFMLKITQPKP